MNECEQIHPLLRGYLAESLSARDRRLVARHLNLCASARKELDRLRSGPLKAPNTSAEPPSEPWDLKILRWLFKTPKPVPRQLSEGNSKKNRGGKRFDQPGTPEPPKSSSSFILWIILFFVALGFLTHFIQNAGENPEVKAVKRWLSKNGYHVFGVTSSLELVLDLTSLTHWEGNAAPAAIPFQYLITDLDHYRIYWQLLQGKAGMPEVDFSKNALAVVFSGAKTTAGYIVKFKRMENYTDKTILWYDEAIPTAEQAAKPLVTRPWVLQLVPKPAQQPVYIQKIQ